jgi:mercuric ion transport protein
MSPPLQFQQHRAQQSVLRQVSDEGGLGKCLAVSLSMPLGAKSSIVAGALAAIGASVCCVGPLVLLMLGVSGAWISYLTAFEPFRPYFIGLTLLFLFLAFRKLYFVKRACATGETCADNRVLNRQRLIFWFLSIPLLLLVAFPWYAPLLF